MLTVDDLTRAVICQFVLLACGGDLTSEHGSLASPAYPNSYPLSTECIWTISASAGIYKMGGIYKKVQY